MAQAILLSEYDVVIDRGLKILIEGIKERTISGDVSELSLEFIS